MHFVSTVREKTKGRGSETRVALKTHPIQALWQGPDVSDMRQTRVIPSGASARRSERLIDTPFALTINKSEDRELTISDVVVRGGDGFAFHNVSSEFSEETQLSREPLRGAQEAPLTVGPPFRCARSLISSRKGREMTTEEALILAESALHQYYLQLNDLNSRTRRERVWEALQVIRDMNNRADPFD